MKVPAGRSAVVAAAVAAALLLTGCPEGFLAPPLAVEVGLGEADWTQQGSTIVVAGFADGVITFQQSSPAAESSETQLTARAPDGAAARDFRSVSARIGFAQGAQGDMAHIAINLRTEADSGEYWVEANLMHSAGSMSVYCRAGTTAPSGVVNDYELGYRDGLALAVAYDLRIDLEAESGSIRWYLGGVQIASASAPGLARLAERPAHIVLNSFRSAGSTATTFAEGVAYRLAL